MACSTEQVGERLRRERQPSLRRVINATGIVLHTNLGRAPFAAAAIDAVAEIGSMDVSPFAWRSIYPANGPARPGVPIVADL